MGSGRLGVPTLAHRLLNVLPSMLVERPRSSSITPGGRVATMEHDNCLRSPRPARGPLMIRVWRGRRTTIRKALAGSAERAGPATPEALGRLAGDPGVELTPEALGRLAGDPVIELTLEALGRLAGGPWIELTPEALGRLRSRGSRAHVTPFTVRT
jgi:hypothetical protein